MPSMGCDGGPTWWFGPFGPKCRRDEVDVDPVADVGGGSLVGQGLQMDGLISGEGTG
jgi:hypothetical protein